ncbi:hypothetical protein [Mesorhizobium sp. YM1C-6-2]|uniref:hypothetical protein n=1 Tax=Mesorhizobium sp. YM1C-6-2 TaxID=1827501 RepID=UPI0011C36974|nr:hypothetical protein [Mesorhizobium sp. YM1C-6-2]
MDSRYILTIPGRTTEADLVLPALQILAESANPGRGLTTAELAKALRDRLVATEDDLKILEGRKDDRLSQTIRNLVSHRRLARQGLATYEKNPVDGQGYHRLTAMGFRTITEQRRKP